MKAAGNVLLILLFSISIVHGQEFDWANRAGYSETDGGKAIATDQTGNVYTAGFFQGVVDFDPGPSIFNMTSNGYSDIFISKLDINGNFIWAKQIGGSQSDEPRDLHIDGAGNVIITGLFHPSGRLVDLI